LQHLDRGLELVVRRLEESDPEGVELQLANACYLLKNRPDPDGLGGGASTADA